MGVRRESVELSLNDVDFSLGMAKAAAQTAILNSELGRLDGTTVKANKSTSAFGDPNGGLERTSKSSRKASADLNQFTGRLSVLVSTAALVGPAILPISAAAIPAVSGLAAGLGAAAGAASVALLAFNGLGDALKALDAYQLEPTADNLQKLNQQLEAIGPAGADFVRFLDSLEPELRTLQNAARDGLFPGIEDGLRSLLPLLPEVRDFVAQMSTGLGSIASRAGASLANDDDWQKFFHYLETDGVSTMDAFAVATGNVAAGLASLLRDMAPLTAFFTDGLVSASASFREWADGLDQTQGFRDFVSYVQESGPKVLSLLEALGEAFLGLVHAMQPIADVALPALTALANLVGVIGQSDIGPVLYTTAAALTAVSLGGKIASKSMSAFALSETSAAAAGTKLTGVLKALRLAVVAYAAADVTGSLVTSGFDSLAGDAGVVGASLRNGDRSKFTNPLSVIGFNPDHLGDKKPVQQADQTLAMQVASGDAAGASKQLAKYAAEADMSVVDATKHFPAYTAAVKASGDASATTAVAVQSQSQALTDLVSAMQAQTSEALSAFDAETQYREALNAATEQAKKSNAGIKGNSEAALKNREALSGLAAAWNNQDDAVKNNVGRFKAARKAFVDAATGMGVSKQAAHALARQLLEIPDRIVARVELGGTGAALADLRAVKREIASVPKRFQTTYYVNQVGSINRRAVGGRDGDPKTPYWGGGWTGDGGKYEPAGVVHGNEVVLPSDVVNQDAAFLKSRYGYLPGMQDLPGYAEGGRVGSRGSGTTDRTRTRVSDDALARALDRFVDSVESRGRGKGTTYTADVDLSRYGIGRALKKLETAADHASDALDKTKESADSFASGIASGLTRDPWESSSSGSVFSSSSAGGSLAAATASLNSQAAEAREFRALSARLKGKVSDSAYLDLTGRGDVNILRAAASSSAADLRAYSAAFTSRGAEVQATSSQARQAEYGKEIKAQTNELKQINIGVRALRHEQKDRAAKATAAAKKRTAVHAARSTGGKRK